MREGPFLPFTISRAAVSIGVLLLITRSLDAPIRYYSSALGVTPAIYLPNALGFFVLAAAFLAALMRGYASRTALAIGSLFVVYSAWGAMNVGSYVQVAFGIYVFMPLFLGLVAFHAAFVYRVRFRTILTAIHTVVLAGIVLDIDMDFPWKGTDVAFGEYQIEVSRSWEYFGVDRPAGFSRASFDAAIQLITVGSLLIGMHERRWRRVAVWLLTLLGTILTTTKAAIIAAIIVGGFLVIRENRWPQFARLVTIGTVTTGLVLMATHRAVGAYLDAETPFWRTTLMSLKMRLDETWPAALNAINESGNYALGRGIGGIGSPNLIFESAHYISPDSLIIHAYGLFGLIGIGAILWVAWHGTKREVAAHQIGRSSLPFVMVFFVYGIVGNILESVFSLFFLGIVIRAVALNGKVQRDLLSK